MKSFAFIDSASRGRTARVGRIFGSAVFAVVMGASFGVQAGELDGAQSEDVLLGVNAVIDGGLSDERGTGLLDRRNRNGDQGADANGVVGQGDVSATAGSSGTAVGVSVSAGNLSVAISNTTLNQTVNQSATFRGGSANAN